MFELQDTDKIFELWEKSIDAYYRNMEELTIAEANYNSGLAKAIANQRLAVGSTLAKDVAKSDVHDLFIELGEADRKVKAGKEKLQFLKELNIDRRMKQRADDQIVKGA